ncbi:Dabb family protein [Xylanibacillus composti]|uniref:Stress responsive protein n=1 Tax=Xylanibacillus composti TaxID=1572762 RepID=A0A8J4GZL9_9BACL|nr:Dabb family protein [Xylanibacillus composti]MDT9724908.1 Dabb family protein [Xylanibacillus composti]GIQ68143.1 stress responsive protein [Xylanibacillus composti]
MLTHIVFFKLKNREQDNIRHVRDTLLSMKGRIPELLELEVGADIVRSARSFDLALVSKFKNLDAMQAYQVHPVHQEIIAFMREQTESSAAVDYESEA